MIKVITYIFILFFIPVFISAETGGSLFAETDKTVSSKPEIAFEQAIFIAKGIIEGDEIIHTFTVLNTGAVPLHILKVKPG